MSSAKRACIRGARATRARRLRGIAAFAAAALLASTIAATAVAQSGAAPASGTSATSASSATSPAPSAVAAQPQSGPSPTSLLPTQAERERFHRLAEELRCLVCQNQTLADSDADLAMDLRREVETMMLAGRSDDEIKSFLVQRYGDFVLYRPPMQRNTWLLWLGPFALLSIGAIAWWRIQRRRQPHAGGNLERARQLLDD